MPARKSLPPHRAEVPPGSGAPGPAGAPAPNRFPLLAALLCALLGLLDIASGLTPEMAERLRLVTAVLPGALTHAAAAATVISGVLLLLLARGLRRRKHRAWLAVVSVLAISIAFHLAKGLDVEEALLSAVILAVLVAQRRQFGALADPRTRWRAPAALVLLAVLSVGLGVILVLLQPVAGARSAGSVLATVLSNLVGGSGPLQFTGARGGDLVSDTLGGLGLLTAVTPVWLLLRPAEPRAALLPGDDARVRRLLSRHGDRDSLGYFALRGDKSLIWSPSGKSCIAYRVVNGVMLASGDPVGDPEAWPGAIQPFLAEAARHAWTPGVLGCGRDAGEAWQRAGLEVLEVGDEAVLELAGFDLTGRAMRNVRQAVARVERAGYTAEVSRVRDLPPERLSQLRARAGDWRGSETERGFSMALGRFGAIADGDCVVVCASQPSGSGTVPRALLHFVPWGTCGLSLDLMRRDRTADNGLNEFLIVAMLRAAPALGVTRLSLNFAVFRSALEGGQRLGAGPVLRGWRRLLVFASRWLQIESLYRFNAKFSPRWEPRYVCYPAARELPKIALAALEAEAFLLGPGELMGRLVAHLPRPVRPGRRQQPSGAEPQAGGSRTPR